MYFVFPARRISSSVPIDSSSGVSKQQSQNVRSRAHYKPVTRTRIDPVEVVEVGSETQPLNRPVDVLLDVSC